MRTKKDKKLKVLCDCKICGCDKDELKIKEWLNRYAVIQCPHCHSSLEIAKQYSTTHNNTYYYGMIEEK